MNTKLTLSLEKKIIEQAKVYAKGTGRSLSQMVESYFRNVVQKTDVEYDSVDARVKKLIGVIKLPPDFDMEKAKEEYHREKYGI